jgi:hypothetical protein
MRTDKQQRGAALITVLLLSTLLLATGGALVLVTSLSQRTTIDATAEMQAYYSAETGLQDTLNVLRGNVNPVAGMPANSKINFLKAVTPTQSNRSTDNSGLRHLSGWLNYSVNDANGNPDRVALACTGCPSTYSRLTGLAYRVLVSDPDAATTPAGAEPTRLLLQVFGFGPKGAEKHLELIVKRSNFDYTPPAMLMIRGADDCSGASFTAGNSAAKDYSGHDNAPTGTVLPTYGATCPVDKTTEINADTKDTVADPKAATIAISDLPKYLQTTDGPEGARAFLDDQRVNAQNSVDENGVSRYFTSFDGYAGTHDNPVLTFVDGNCTLDGGAGTLIVTGTLTMNGNPSFEGLILVLGDGIVNRNGAGNGTYLGAMAVARFNRTSGPFLAPSFLTDGDGTSLMQFDSDALRRALNLTGPRSMGIREF